MDKDSAVIFLEDGRVKNRLREIRKAKGLTLEDVAARAGTSPTQVSRLERSRRRLSDHWIERLAPILDASPRDMFVDGDDNQITVPIIGYVGAGETVYNFDDGAMEHVVPPDGAEETVGVEVRGDSMWPAYRPRDRLFFYRADFISGDVLGEDCIVQVKNGPTYVKTVWQGTKPGLYRLSSHRAPEIQDVELVWAARIRWIERP